MPGEFWTWKLPRVSLSWELRIANESKEVS